MGSVPAPSSSSPNFDTLQIGEKPDFCNHNVLQRNRLPPRAYFLPTTSLLLNGIWDFNYASNPLEAPDPKDHNSFGGMLPADRDIFTPSESSDGALITNLDPHQPGLLWTTIQVPGNWQLQGHGRPQYTNVIYPFPVCPPYVPTDNPTGTYRRSFHIPSDWETSTQLRLRFDGVDSAFHVWVNGLLVGYSQGSRNPAEFDITTSVDRSAANEVFVRVYQWCDGSYIEDQDQWWLSGIFRDVHLLAFPGAGRIEDFFVRTDLDEMYKDAVVRVTLDLHNTEGGEVSLVLRDPSKSYEVIAQTRKTSSVHSLHLDIELPVSNPKKWTAETPYLYQLEMSLISSQKPNPIHTIHQNIGFRSVELKNGHLTVNGKPILLRGVNRHEHHPYLGRAVPISFIKQDLLLMKSNNINALRCSHYPSHPKLYDLCDELGLWVMDEADLECHGFYDAVARPLDIPEEMDYEQRKVLAFSQAAEFTSDNEEWKEAYLDRMRQVVQRDKNHPSIIIWSLGNEAFYGRNHKAMYDYAKSVDPGRLVHYEGDANALSADMFSYMYPSVEHLIRLAKTEGINSEGHYEKPMVLCEYAHAMGNGPGSLEDYQKAFREYSRLQGGFVWEWANHGLYKKEGDRGFFAYGGDFGDIPNDGTFVMDGLCFSDHSPTPGLIEFKKVIEPVRLIMEGERLFVENGYDFIGLEHLVAAYKVETFGNRIDLLDAGELSIPSVGTGQRAEMSLPNHIFSYRTPYETFITISFRLRSATSWADASHEIAWWQHKLPSQTFSLSESTLPPCHKLHVQESKLAVQVSGSTWSLKFDRARGYLTNWVSGGLTLLQPDSNNGAAIIPSFWRAPTDNDVPSALPYWRRFGLDQMTSQLRSFTVCSDNKADLVEIKTQTYLSPPILAWGYNVQTTYTIFSSGSLNIKVRLQPTGSHPKTIPRVGLNMYLSQTLDQVSWFGPGPGESYPDKRSSQKVGIWSKAIPELQTNYEVPQENGNRIDTRWLNINNSRGVGIKVTGEIVRNTEQNVERTFQWQAGRHTAAAIEAARHPCDLTEEDATLLKLNAEVAGVGTAACGPGVREEFQVRCREVEFSFTLEKLEI